jgi:hypothetical protein
VADETGNVDAVSRPAGPRRGPLGADGLHPLPEIVGHRRVDDDTGFVRASPPPGLDPFLVGEPAVPHEIAVVHRVAEELRDPGRGQRAPGPDRDVPEAGRLERERVVAVVAGRIQLEQRASLANVVGVWLEDWARTRSAPEAECRMAARVSL